MLILFTMASDVVSLDNKTLTHIATIPVTEGLGIYSSARVISDGNGTSKAMGIANISLLAINAGLGSYILFGKPSHYNTLRMIHHIMGFTAIGTALGMTIAASLDNKVPTHVKYVSGGYTLMTTVPIFVFNF